MRLLNKIFVVCGICFFASLDASAQQLGYSQYFINLPSENAGFTGIEDFLDFKLGSKQGWSDFSDVNSSVFVSAYGMLNKPLKQMVKNNALRVGDPSSFDKIITNKKLRRKHGLGGFVKSIALGPYKTSAININYAYHLPISKQLTWSLGTKIGADFENVDLSNFTVRDEVNDTFYLELLNSNEGRRTSLITDFGTVLYSNKFYLAISTYNMISTSINSDNLLDHTRLPRYQFLVGKVVNLNENLALSLGGQTFYSESYDSNWMVNARLKYRSILYFGGAYENETKFSVLAGLMSQGKFSAHYAYNNYLRDLSSFSVSSHEFIIGVFIFNKYAADAKLW
jgi:type IX secretion system PorP/SprF family membrane protein